MDDRNLMKQKLIEANEIICEVDEYLEKKLTEAAEQDDIKAANVAYESRQVLQHQIGEIAGRLFESAKSRERTGGSGFERFTSDCDQHRSLSTKLIALLQWLNRDGDYSSEGEKEFLRLANGLLDDLEGIVGVRGGKVDG